MEPLKQKNFEKLHLVLRPKFSATKQPFFNGRISKIRFFLIFCFASFHCLKALTGRLEKREISVK